MNRLSLSVTLAYALYSWAFVAPPTKETPMVIKSDDDGEPATVSTDTPPLPADLPKQRDRLIYVQITDDEMKRLDLLNLFEHEFPEEFAATGGPTDLNSFFGVIPLIIKPSGTVAKTHRAGYLVPLQLVRAYGSKMKNQSGGWDNLADDSPKPMWLQLHKE